MQQSNMQENSLEKSVENLQQQSAGVSNQQWLKRRSEAVPRGVASACNIFASHAKNSELWDIEGNRYIDFAGGIAVLNTGHTHPKIVNAVKAQVDKFSHTAFQVLQYPSYIELAEQLNVLAPGDSAKKTLLLSTGAEAVENAVKIARAHTGRTGIISFIGGFHGRTLGTLALTGKVDPYKIGFGPFINEVFHVPFPMQAHGVTVEDSLAALHKIFKADIEPSRVAAIVIEPVQGEGGFYAAPQELMTGLRAICDEYGILLICDEVQCGIGRTGKMFATEHYGIEPDMMTVAKSIGSGYPISAVIGKQSIMDTPAGGALGGTYGGNPVACAAALAVLQVIKEENLLERANQIGHNISTRLHTYKANNNASSIGEIRSLGAMSAFELVDEQGRPDAAKAKQLTQLALSHNLILLSCGLFGNTIRVLVPLTVSDEVLVEGMDIIEKCISDLA